MAERLGAPIFVVFPLESDQGYCRKYLPLCTLYKSCTTLEVIRALVIEIKTHENLGKLELFNKNLGTRDVDPNDADFRLRRIRILKSDFYSVLIAWTLNNFCCRVDLECFGKVCITWLNV
jgi:hypothetical protein